MNLIYGVDEAMQVHDTLSFLSASFSIETPVIVSQQGIFSFAGQISFCYSWTASNATVQLCTVLCSFNVAERTVVYLLLSN